MRVHLNGSGGGGGSACMCAYVCEHHCVHVWCVHVFVCACVHVSVWS